MSRVLSFASDNWLTLAVGQFKPGKGWVQATDDYPSPPPNQVYTLFGNTGKLGEVVGKNERRPDPSWVPLEWRARIDRGPMTTQPYALAIQGSWPDTGAQSKELSSDDPASRQVVSDFLKKHGIRVDDPLVTQAYAVDINGDGQVETVVCAHSDDELLKDDQPAAIYALALVREGTGEKGKTYALAGQYSFKPAGQSVSSHEQFHGTRDFYRIIGIYDIDGDGHKEIALYRAKDDATQVDVFTFRGPRPHKVLSAYKAHYD